MTRENEISVIVYEIWQQEGCLDGHDCDHWLKAEMIWEERQKKGTDSKESKKQPAQTSGQGRGDRTWPRR